MTILAIAAHNDDHIIGCGGTLAHYAKQGERIVTIICSHAENSHLHLKKRTTLKKRIAEALKANKLFGGQEVIFLGIRDGHFQHDLKARTILIKNIITKEKPEKIFTHSDKDWNKDHKELSKYLLSLADKGSITCPIFSFSIWSALNIVKQSYPVLVVDTAATFQTKLKAFLVHESQTLISWAIIWKLMIKDRICGTSNKHRYAEAFYKLR